MQLSLLLLACVGAALGRDYHRDPHRGAPLSLDGLPRPDHREFTAEYWRSEARAAIEAKVLAPSGLGVARNVVMFLGDGMSVPTLAAARTLQGQRQGRPGEESQLYFESFPTVGLAKTYCLDGQIADSACTATAYLCGAKANRGTIGVSGEVPRYDCDASLDLSTHLDSIAAWALADGRDAGIVTTTRVTHASPAGAFANVANRHWEHDGDVAEDGHDAARCPDIAHQLVHSHPGNKFKVILGGGRRAFLHNDMRDEEGTRGRRTDNRNLIEEWQEAKRSQNVSHSYVWNREQLMEIADSPPEYLLGLFEGGHMQYNLEADARTEPTLAELVEVAVRSLSRNPRGFFLFVEGGRIDHAHHDNLPLLALDETLALAEGVRRAAEMLPARESLLLVTADHAHVMAFNGYARRGSSVVGPSDDRDDDGVPYMTLSYTNGPGARRQTHGRRVDVTQDAAFGHAQWPTHAEAPLESETHGGDDVAVFARGPSHHMFAGLYEQSQLPHLMAYAACIGPGPTVCDGFPRV